ncbi:hypothetical protein TNIN_304691 [Trichonephila inaurata madagascariensis]|uniref:Uncharacterized protein n=1 Tax=Trichonephila inaurata madagascariensis TaxID=2747483 RepID=A0A8X6IYD7_9ARAC|nr:hypothetical protein TNIN_304691 [Trichonephila inaurata madagascariensis]
MIHKISSHGLRPSQRRILDSFKRLLGTHVTTEHGGMSQISTPQFVCISESPVAQYSPRVFYLYKEMNAILLHSSFLAFFSMLQTNANSA